MCQEKVEKWKAKQAVDQAFSRQCSKDRRLPETAVQQEHCWVEMWSCCSLWTFIRLKQTKLSTQTRRQTHQERSRCPTVDWIWLWMSIWTLKSTAHLQKSIGFLFHSHIRNYCVHVYSNGTKTFFFYYCCSLSWFNIPLYQSWNLLSCLGHSFLMIR